MNIFVAFNDAFALPTKVMLKSLILNNPGPLVIFVFYSSLEQSSIDRVRELEDGDRVVFRFRKVEDSFLDGIEIPPRFSRETYYRLLAHRLFDEDAEKVLWLDGDIIVTGSLLDFYEQDFHGKLYIAYETPSPESFAEKRRELKMPPEATYINSGVMLFNLKDARKTLNDAEIVQYLADNQSILRLGDQDVFNGLLYRHFYIAAPDHLYNFSARFIKTENKRFVDRNVRVIHYAGDEKPWKKNFPFHGFFLWWKYAWNTVPEFRAVFPAALLTHPLAKLWKSLVTRFSACGLRNTRS